MLIILIHSKSVIDHVLARCTEFLVPFDDLVDGFDQIFLCYGLSPVADREHACLSAH